MSNPADIETTQNSESQQAKLSAEDLARVDKYLSSPIHSVERKPFKSMWMMLALVGVVIVLGLLSQLIAWLVL